MAASGPKLTAEQRETLLTWLAADYNAKLIRSWLAQREWPDISDAAISQHRQKFMPEIEKLRAERHAAALTTGLALKEERVARLSRHADDLDEIKWYTDDKGKLWNEKAWRETLDDIAKEMGHRSSGVNVNLNRMPDDELVAAVKEALDPAGPGADGGADPAGDQDPAADL